MIKELTPSWLKEAAKQYALDRGNAMLRHALSRSSLSSAIFVSQSKPNAMVSLDLKTMPVCDQHASGRCWIFAGLNLLRELIADNLGAKSFELSQNYIAFFDKIEKSNFALESLLSLSKGEPGERVYMHILNDPVSDGGQWDMFVNLVLKYGLAPKYAYLDTYQASNTRETDFLVNAAIRGFAAKAHKLVHEGKEEEARQLKEQTMASIYDMFLSAFGFPPESFRLVYEDKQGKRVDKGEYTPKSFFEEFLGKEKLLSYQSLINSPTQDKPFMRNFTIDYLGNVIEGNPINHLNVTMPRMEEAIIAQLKSGTPVWFGSDVSFNRDRELDYWATETHDYKGSFGFGIAFDKGDMLTFRHSAMNHAMLIVGVDLDEQGRPLAWKIENSWGEKTGDKGYFYMSESWFKTFVYQAVVDKAFLTEQEKEAASKEPTHLNPWDPMGTLAC